MIRFAKVYTIQNESFGPFYELSTAKPRTNFHAFQRIFGIRVSCLLRQLKPTLGFPKRVCILGGITLVYLGNGKKSILIPLFSCKVATVYLLRIQTCLKMVHSVHLNEYHGPFHQAMQKIHATLLFFFTWFKHSAPFATPFCATPFVFKPSHGFVHSRVIILFPCIFIIFYV